MRVILLAPFGIIFAAEQGYATTVEEGIKLCQAVFQDQPNWRDAVDASFCLGITEGVARIMTLNCFSVGDDAKPEVYLSADAPPSTSAAVQAFLNWANDNPQEWDEAFNLGVMQSMASTFPCMALGN